MQQLEVSGAVQHIYMSFGSEGLKWVKLVLNQMFIFLIVTLISFMNSVGLGLVTIRLVSSAERINLDFDIVIYIVCNFLQVINVQREKQWTEEQS
jgi:hypothetical protein